MSIFITIIGWLVILFLASGICSWGVSLLIDSLDRRQRRVEDKERQAEDKERQQVRIELGIRMAQDAFWLTESNEAFLAVREYGEGLIKNRSIDDVRDRWRQSVKNANRQHT